MAVVPALDADRRAVVAVAVFLFVVVAAVARLHVRMAVIASLVVVLQAIS